MQIEYTGPIETIWQHVDGLVNFTLQNMNNNPQSF